LKTKNWNVWILKIENWNVWIWKQKTEMYEWWNLKIEMSEYWKVKIEMFEYWKINFEYLYEISSINLFLHSNDAYANPNLVATTNRENAIISTLARSRMKIQSTFVAPPINPKN
jgi:hypothetical protein